MARKRPPQGVDVDHEGVYSGSEIGILDKPKSTNKIRYCKICKKKLSMYNLNIYCLAHQIEGQAIEDRKEDDIKMKRTKRWLRARYDRERKNVKR